MLRQLAASLATVALLAPLGCGGGTKQTTRTADPLVQAPTQALPPTPTPMPMPDGTGPIGEGPKGTDPKAVVVDPKTGPEIAKDPVIEQRPKGTPKAINKTVEKGLAWLASAQLDGGGWGQGDEAARLRPNEPKVGIANVADTSMALLAFIRSGNTPAAGQYKTAVDRGLTYVMQQIEESDSDSLYVSSVRGTRVQLKIGQYADTFAALMVLNEAKGKMKDPASNARLDAALKKVVRKVEKNQRDNGSWDDKGWAPVLSQALAAKGMNRAAQNGAPVSKQTLMRIEEQAKRGQMSVSGSAGVGLYGEAASSANIRDDAETKKAKASTMKAKAAKSSPSPMAQSPDAPTKAEIAAAEAEAYTATKDAVDKERALVARLKDPSFVQGFGNNGGEEFLSYLLISETLVQSGGEEWARWDAAISKLVGGVQNEDGSWTGHHCITGRTFCTAAALLVLLGDRTPAAHNVIATTK